MKLDFALLGRTENISEYISKLFCFKIRRDVQWTAWNNGKPLYCKYNQSGGTDFSTRVIKQENVLLVYIFQTHVTSISQDNVLKSLLPF